jgi:hypothetical protein
VQEEHDLPSRRAPSRLELERSTGWRCEDLGTGSRGAIDGPISAAAVDDDDLDLFGVVEIGVAANRRLGRISAFVLGARDGLLDRLRLVERRDHHGDVHGAHDSPPRGGLTARAAVAYPFAVSRRDDAETPSDAPEKTAPSYAKAGVDLDHDEGFRQRDRAHRAHDVPPEVLSGIGGFAGLFKTPDRYRDPILVASADGVGTKLKLAAQLGRWDTVGIDCVAMVVNDLVVQGAEPLVFLDYVAMGALDTKVAADALRGVAEGCRRAGCALLGGETATMPGTYERRPRAGRLRRRRGRARQGRRRLDDQRRRRAGRPRSNGVHSNGFSLVRRILEPGLRPARSTWAEVEELNARSRAR